jgi:phosphoglycerate dehydrogenase-like enzyme
VVTVPVEGVRRRPAVMAQVAADRIAEQVPEVEVRAAPLSEPVPDDLEGEILFGSAAWSPTLGTLLDRGVRWLQLAGTGADGLPAEAFQGRVVTCARGVAAIPIAEFSMAAMLNAVKQLPESWVHEPSPRHGYAELGELHGQTLGLVGLGGIGTELARRAQAMGMRVAAVRRTAQSGPAGVEILPSLDELLPQADHLVLAAPATRHTRQLMNAETFKKCKSGMHLVNVARGALVDHEALLDALDSDIVARATLDVTDPDPLPAGHPLYSHPAVKVSPHISWSSPRFFERLVDVFIDNLRRHLAGETLEGVVDPEAGY